MAGISNQYVYSVNREIIRYLKQTRLFGHLSDELLEKMIPLSDFASLPAETVILEEGQENDKVYFLMRGTVVVRSGGELILKLQRTGDIFGEMSIISDQPASASVISETAVDLFTIRAKDVGKFSDIDASDLQHTLYRIFATILSEKLRFTTFKAQQYEETNARLIKTQEQLQAAYNRSLFEISKRVEAEKTLEVAKHTAQQANRSKSRFLANMSHEIRTPMHGVVGITDLLSKSELTHEQLHLTNVIKKSSNALLTIIDDILDYTKIEIGGIQVQASDTDIRDLVEEVTDLLRGNALEKGIDIISHIDTNIPDLFKCDPVRLRQVLINLIENAVKFTPEGTVSVDAQHLEQEDKPTLQFSISDTGIGIAAEDQETIFNEFYQANHPTTERVKGSGLGLTITRQLVVLMGGEIHVESELEKGSRFWFTITEGEPVSDLASRASAYQTPQVAQPQVPIKPAETARILVAEDDYINQQVIILSLRRLNYEPEVVTNGEEVIEILKKKDFDLVFMDIQMPKLDGFETTRLIRNPGTGVRNPDIPVIALTAHAIKGYQDKCLAAGMNGHLSKPFQMETLDETVSRWTAKPAVETENGGINEDSQSSAEPFDSQTIQRLRTETGKEFGNLIKLYLEELPTKIELITKAIEHSDIEDIKATAHRLKSNSAIFGAVALATLCEELEHSEAEDIEKNGRQWSTDLREKSSEILQILKTIN